MRTEAINAYLSGVAGAPISAKDSRTLHASALAAEALAALEQEASATGRRRQQARVAEAVSQVLSNTPAICRMSYIAPCLFNLFEAGKLGALWSEDGASVRGLKPRERRLAAVLAAAG